MSYLIKPKNYKPLLDLKQTELGIKQIKRVLPIKLIIRTTPATCDSPPVCVERHGYQR